MLGRVVSPKCLRPGGLTDKWGAFAPLGKTDVIKSLIFDLDGTLLDTLDDLADSMNFALMSLGFPPRSRTEHKTFIGSGVEIFATRALPEHARDKETISRCVEINNQEYGRRYRFKTLPYSGMTDVLHNLQRLALPLAVLSNKKDEFAKLITNDYFPRIKFTVIQGAKENVLKKPHPDAALQIASIFNLPAEHILFVGDSPVDMQTAKNAGMIPLGVSWGFSSIDDLKKSGAIAIVNEPHELLAYVITHLN